MAESVLRRVLEPLAASLEILFLLVSLAVGALWAVGGGEPFIARWITNRDLSSAVFWLLARLDVVWIILAAVCVYGQLAAQQGIRVARQWAVLIFGVVTAMAWVSGGTGFLLGPIEYSRQLGMKLGPVPVGLPLLWLATILASRSAALWSFPKWSQAQIAWAVGVLGALTDFNLEPLAAKLRGFWFWRAREPGLPPVFDSPPTSCLVWGVMAGLLAFLLHERSVVAAGRKSPGRSALPLLVFHAVFVAGHLGRWWRG